jgi:hypothetical protein
MSTAKSSQKLLDNGGDGPGLNETLAASVLGRFLYPGKVEFLVVPPEEIPDCYILANGDLYPLTSPTGTALNNLSAAMKEVLGIAVNGSNINAPNFFDPETGYGYFLRAVDGVDRLVGSKQGDAIRNFSGMIGANINIPSQPYVQTGPFYFDSKFSNTILSVQSSSVCNYGDVYMDPSTVVPTADENRPSNVGALPCVYIGELAA